MVHRCVSSRLTLSVTIFGVLAMARCSLASLDDLAGGGGGSAGSGALRDTSSSGGAFGAGGAPGASGLADAGGSGTGPGGTGTGDADGGSPEGARDARGAAEADGAVASADAGDADGERDRCPETAGPAMVELDGYCIDSTEVTNAQYAAFLASLPDVNLPPSCASKESSFQPEAWPPPAGSDELPVVGVDWCDAWAFCTWADKRLCRGDTDPFSDAGAPASSEWFQACSNGGTTRFPYGTDYVASTCVGAGYETGSGGGPPVPVGNAADCRGTVAPYSAIHDMSGNVAEWVDECGRFFIIEACLARGGSYVTGEDFLECADRRGLASRTTRADTVGFRCCATCPSCRAS